MKLVASCLLAASLALVVVACTSSTEDPDSNTAADLKKKKANTCAAAGGTCVGLSPTSCQNGYWADATKASCGSGLGVGCCLECPTLSPPAPNFCADDATPTPVKDANGCVTGYQCPPSPPPPAPTSCEDIGGTCVGLAPSSCPSGRWADATQASCGSGVGVGCCLPSCPELTPLPPDFCDGGPTTPIKNASGCIIGFDCN